MSASKYPSANRAEKIRDVGDNVPPSAERSCLRNSRLAEPCSDMLFGLADAAAQSSKAERVLCLRLNSMIRWS
jgi:hypothetical protein